MGTIVGSAILFADLVGTSEYAGALELLDYDALIGSFERVCLRQTRHFFETADGGRGLPPGSFHFAFVGDQLVAYLHGGPAASDVHQLLCLAATLKCAWLGTLFNRDRIDSGRPVMEVAIGIHYGPIVRHAADDCGQPIYRGYAINLAKRIESSSREGRFFRVLVSDMAHKALGARSRGLLFGARSTPKFKGFHAGIGVRELVDSFVDVSRRCEPGLLSDFLDVAPSALATTTFDHWIFSSFQVITGERCGCVTDACLDRCAAMLYSDPGNAVALFSMARGMLARGRLADASLYADRLIASWPYFADAWLERARLCKLLGDAAGAERSLRMAQQLGVTDAEVAAAAATPEDAVAKSR